MISKSKIKKLFLLIGVLSFVAYGCSFFDDDTPATGGGGDGGVVAGKVAKGYVKNATVIADKIVANGVGNFELDDDEVSVTSDDDGDFEFPSGTPSYDNYVLLSIGGTVKDADGNDVPAPPLLAPAGSANITPVTTLVAFNPELADKIGPNYDADIADPEGVSGDIMQLAMTAKAILDLFTDPGAPLVTDIADQLAVFDNLADALNAQDDLSDDSIKAAVDAGVSAALDDLVDPVNNTDAVKDAIADAVDNIIDDIDETADFVVEDDAFLADIEAIVDAGAGEVDAAATTVSIQVTKVDANDADSALVVSLEPGDAKSIDKADAETIKTLDITLDADNEYLAGEEEYTDASLFVTIIDESSLREVTLEITKVTVTVTFDDVVTIVISDDTQLLVNGKNVDGDVIRAELDNEVAGQDIISVTGGNVVTVDLDKLEAKIQNVVGADHDLFNIGLRGNFAISTTAEGVPLAPFSGNMEVQNAV